MSRTHTQVTYNRLNHLPTPDELKYRQGKATVVAGQTTPANVDIVNSVVEVVNAGGATPIEHVISNPSDGKLTVHSQLYTKQVRNRWTGEIIGTFSKVYNWTKRSITYLYREGLVVNGIRYDLDPRVGHLNGRPSDTSDGQGPVNRSKTIHFPFDVEIYDPANAGDMLGPDIDYTVTFVTWDGAVISTQLVKPGGTATAPSPPVRPGNTFVGWSEDFVNVQRDMIIRPVYANDTMTVTWQNWDGIVLKTEQVKFGQAATPPADPTKIGHEFSGWDVDYTFIAADTVITALFTPHMFTVTFLDWDGYFISSQQVAYGTPPILVKDPIREHYNFVGWDQDLTSITSDVTAKAVYEIQKFTVTYVDSLTGKTISTEEVEYGQPGTPPAWPPEDPFYDAYEFLGWDCNLDSITDHYWVEAVYVIKTIEITVIDDTNGALIDQYTIPFGTNFIPVVPPDHTDIGLDFDGWEGNYGATLMYMREDTIVYAKYTWMWLSVYYLTEDGALKTPPEVYWEDRVRYDFSLADENILMTTMYNRDKTMYVEYWYFISKETGQKEILTLDTKIKYDMICYPSFTPILPPEPDEQPVQP